MERKTLIYLSTLTFVIGIALFAWRNEWIIIHIPALFRPTGANGVVAIEKKTITISFYKQDGWRTENLETIWEQNAVTKNSARLAGAYFTLLYEEALTEQKIGVEAASTDPKGTTLYLSLTHNPLPAEASVKEKLMIIEGLLRTLREAIPALTKITLLVHHQPLTDYHLDFTQPWELTGWLNGQSNLGNNQEVVAAYQRAQSPHKFKILLDPTGDAQYTGRIIEDTFERGVSLQVAQEVKHALEDLHPEISTLLTRIPGETVEPLQNATFANRLPADLFVHIGITSHAKPIPTISVYVLNATPTNLIPFEQSATNKPLSFEPYTQAHESISPVSFAQAHEFVRELKGLGAQLPATIVAPVALPFHPLVGMSIPAFGIEIAVKSKEELKALIAPLAHALGQLSAPKA